MKTLCWKCANACGDCSWSNHWEHLPVPGWKAVPTEMRNDFRVAVSYIVTECPEFVPEKPKKAAVNRTVWMEAALRRKNCQN